eukprot:CAMPEP_0116890782 /NCGR_PEP_ID=MMETSP0467-20121206/1301_1 /TAXON_ID=283647 /ORGANISM="Mesodinium pulex, Strain SPMC105" /LENGTH=114 /DNA_ID=CAMNT_0004558847 /DNA_START=663 /DNA_END=1007 /DNA_ORIENTATION=+
MLNTTIQAVMAGSVVWVIELYASEDLNLEVLCNGFLVGLVSSTGGCDAVELKYSFVIGIVAGCIYKCFSFAVSWMEVDDPLDAFSVHGGGGLWALVSTGMFHPDGMISGQYSII